MTLQPLLVRRIIRVPLGEQNMKPLDLIEKWITEHGSATVLRDHVALLKDQLSNLETANSDLTKEVNTLTKQLEVCRAEIENLRAQFQNMKTRCDENEKRLCEQAESDEATLNRIDQV